MPDKSKEKDNLCTACPDCCSHHKNTPRSESSNRQLQNRLNRMIGQLNGIKKMLDDNRYCGELWLHHTPGSHGNLCGGGNQKRKPSDCRRSGGFD